MAILRSTLRRDSPGFGPPRVTTRGGFGFYFARVFRRPFPYLVIGYILVVPLVRALYLPQGEGGLDWALFVFRSVPLAYVAPLIALALGGALGAEDSAGLAGTLPAVGLSIPDQYRNVTLASLAASVMAVGVPLGVGAVVVSRLLPSVGTPGSIIAGVGIPAGFVISTVVIVVAVWMYAVLEYVFGRRVGVVATAAAWLMGVNIASAFLPIGADMFGGTRQTLTAHLILLVVCTSIATSSVPLAWRLER